MKDGSSAVMLRRRSPNDMSSNTRKFLTEYDVYVSLNENLVNTEKTEDS